MDSFNLTRFEVDEYLMWVIANPKINNIEKDQDEQFYFNNLAQTRVTVLKDITNPLLDVTFDGVHILNNDIVSPNPLIVIELNDDISVKVKPFTVASSIMLALYAVEVQQMQRQLQSSPNIDEVAAAEAIRSTLAKSSDRLVELIAASVLEVTLASEPENTVVSDPKQIREWIWVEDNVKEILKLI